MFLHFDISYLSCDHLNRFAIINISVFFTELLKFPLSLETSFLRIQNSIIQQVFCCFEIKSDLLVGQFNSRGEVLLITGGNL